MLSVLMIMMITMTIIFLLIILVNVISKKNYIDREKSSPFECGFDPSSSARIPFSLQFFLIAIIFLIFDVEITLLLPMMIIMKMTNMLMFFTIMSIFIMILLFGLLHEWKQGALEWMI